MVDGADDAALLAAVDGLCASRQWDVLEDLARRCRDALELGKQLWGVATHIDYRLALEGPAAYAARTLVPGAGRFALGPLTEVAASTHTWAELAKHLEHPITAAAVATERAIRGEDLRGEASHLPAELPLALAAWEPRYALPRYRDRSARFPAPPAGGELSGTPERLPSPEAVGIAGHGEPGGARALAETVSTWATQSSGEVRVAAVEGPVESAIAALARDVVRTPLSPADSLALLQWAGASGGAQGQRPGGAAGRFSAWWAAAALTGIEWPEEGDEEFADSLGEAIAELEWVRWRRPEPEAGWVLRMAVADPPNDLAWAVEATDIAEDVDVLGEED